MNDLAWQDRAACQGLTYLFYEPARSETPSARAMRLGTAAACCAHCPVLTECRTWVLEADWCPGGFVAGMTSGERRKIRRRSALASRGLTNA